MKKEELTQQGEKESSRKWFTTRFMTGVAILSAIASFLFYFPEFPVPLMPPWMKLDLSNLPAMIGTFAYGPLAGVLIVAVKDLIGLTHSGTGGIGELADFLISATFVVPAALIYGRRKSRGGALGGMAAGTMGMVIVACLTNYYILIPAFAALMNTTVDAILAMAAQAVPMADSLSLWTYMGWVVVPFNLVKGLLISLVTLLLYKYLSPILHGRKA